MGFWIFMLIISLIMPVSMVGLGKYFSKKAPKDINYVFGYRTPMSMKNKDTWIFAHNYFGRIWFALGLILLPVSVIAMLTVIGKSEDTVGTVGGILCGIQLIPVIAPIIPTEAALRKKFDKDGNRR